jgi:hypothetical protein
MGFMDKAKQAALQAKEQAQHVAQQGQAKVASAQQSRNVGELHRALGEAYYGEQRHGGDHAAVVAALAALDEHFAQASAAAQPAAPQSDGTPGPAAPAAPAPTDAPAAPPAASPAPPPAGNFTLDDL